MLIRGPKTWDEYLDLVHQAVYEIDELKSCLVDEDELEDAALYNQFLGPLDIELRKLFDEMTSGKYQFPAAKDLSFMPLVKQFGRFMPFRGLLETINETHREGLISAD